MLRLILLLLPVLAEAQPPVFDSFMHAAVSVNHFNGNTLVAKSGVIIYQKAFGYSNYSTGELLDNESVFELQSITKQFTAIGVYMLIQKHQLNLQDTLRKFFPELPYSNITIEHLLTHRSGLPDDLDIIVPYWDHKKVAGNKDLIHILATAQMPLHFLPGAQFEYCNTDFELLASIIEQVSHTSYAAFMQQYIFNPLGMGHSYASTSTTRAKSTIPKFATGYIWSDSLKSWVLPATNPETDFVFYDDGMYGAGNICMTTGDLFLFDRALKNNSLLPAAMMEELYKPSVRDSTEPIWWNHASVKLGKNEFGDYIHAGVGGWPGYRTDMIRYTRDDIVVITLSNNESSAGNISGALTYIANGLPVVPAYVHHAIAADNIKLSNLTGSYSIPFVPNPVILVIKQDSGKLFCYLNKSPKGIELFPESPTKFFAAGIELQVEFTSGSNNRPLHSFYIINGLKKEMFYQTSSTGGVQQVK